MQHTTSNLLHPLSDHCPCPTYPFAAPATITSIQVTLKFTDTTRPDVSVTVAPNLCVVNGAPITASTLAAGATATCPWTQQLTTLSQATTTVVVTAAPIAGVTALSTSNTAAPGNVGGTAGSVNIQGRKQARISDTIDSYTGAAVFGAAVPPAALIPADENAALPPNTQFTFTRPVSCGNGDTSTSSVVSTVRLLDTSSAPIASAAPKTGVSGSVTCNRPVTVFTVMQAPVTSVQRGHYEWSIGVITAAPVTVDQPSGALTYTGQVTWPLLATSIGDYAACACIHIKVIVVPVLTPCWPLHSSTPSTEAALHQQHQALHQQHQAPEQKQLHVMLQLSTLSSMLCLEG